MIDYIYCSINVSLTYNKIVGSLSDEILLIASCKTSIYIAKNDCKLMEDGDGFEA